MYTFSELPRVVTGYPLDGEVGWVGILVPYARQNIVSNPSPQRAITGYSAAGAASAARTSGAGRRGAYGVRVTPTSASGDGVFYGTVSLTSSVAYAISVDLKGVPGQTYELSVRTTGGATLVATQVQASGFWDRVWLPYVETSSTTRRIYLTKIGSGTGVFDTDGWQCEPCGSEGTFPTTYIDGNQRGLVPNEFPPAYGWLGTPYASASYRTGQTRAGGRELMIKDWFNFLLTAVIGLGLVTPSIDITSYSQLDGGNFQRARKAGRQFTLAGRFDGANPAELMANRAGLATLLDRDLIAREQPLIVTLQPHDGGIPIGEKVQVAALYSGGMSGNTDNLLAETTAVTFTQYLPLIIGPEAGAALSVQASLGSTAFARRAPDGTWSAIAAVAGGGTDILALAQGLDGRIYVGGDYTDIGGSGADFLAIYDPVAGTWAIAQSATALNGIVRALAVLPNGQILVGGDFTNAGGVANADFLAIYDPVANTYSAVGGIAGANASVRAFAVLNNGTFYVGGTFTDIGASGADYLAYYNGTTYAVVGSATALSDFVDCMVLSLDERMLYIGGNFGSAGGVTGATGIARYDRTLAAYQVVGGAPNAGRAQSLARGADGTIYAGVTTALTSIGGVSVVGVGAWNGAQWQSLINPAVGASSGLGLLVLQDGTLLVSGGPFLSGVTFPDNRAIWNGATWIAVDFLANTSVSSTPLQTPDGALYLGMTSNITATVGAVTTVTNAGGARTYPRLTLQGPTTGTAQVYRLVNTTTNRQINFNLTVNAGETIVLTFEPDNLSFVSDFQGDITPRILPGSQQADFFLQPGANTISLYVSSATVTAALEWTTRYATLDEVVP